MSYKIKLILNTFLIFFVVIFIINCGSSQPGLSGSNKNTISSNGDEDSVEGKPIFIQADDLLKEYRENPAAADERYKDKLIAVKGKITGHFGSDDKILWIGINSEGLTDFSHSDPKEIECGNGDLKKITKENIDLKQEITLVGINLGIQKGITKEDIKNIVLKSCRIEDKTFSENLSDKSNATNSLNISYTEAIPSETPLPDASTGKLPTDGEIQALLEKTIRDLADAIETEDFTKFKTTISKGSIYYRGTAENLKRGFGNKMMLPRLRSIIGTKPIFSRKPFVGKYTLTKADETVEIYSALNLNGVYENTDSPVQFEVQYLAEGKDWKVSVFNFLPAQKSSSTQTVSNLEWEITAGRNYGRFHQFHENFRVKNNGEISCSDTDKKCSGTGKAVVREIEEISEMLKLIDFPTAKKIPDNRYNACIVSPHLPNVYFTLNQKGQKYTLTHCNGFSEKREFDYTLIFNDSKKEIYENLRKKVFSLFDGMRTQKS